MGTSISPVEPGHRWVLLHGTPLTPAIWRGTAAELRDQPVVVPDCTRVPSTDAQQRIAAQVATAVGDHPLDVVGHSFGGQVAIELALQRPENVRSLMIICSRDTPFPAFAATASALRAGVTSSPRASMARWFDPAELAAGGAVVREVERELEQASVADWAAALDAIATFDRRSRSAELTMPVTLVAAGGDTVSTPAAMADFARRLPNATLVVEASWMHMSPFIDPIGLARRVVRARDAALG